MHTFVLTTPTPHQYNMLMVCTQGPSQACTEAHAQKRTRSCFLCWTKV